MTTSSLKGSPKLVEYHPAIDRWMHMVEDMEVLACEEQKMLMPYLREKLKNAVIKSEPIDKAIGIMNKYFPGKLFEWQEFITAFIFGVYEKDGSLMFNEFLIMMGRGGGKTGFMSRLEVALATVEGTRQYHVDIVATSEDQAKESYDEFWDILDDDKKNNGGKEFGKHFHFTKEQYTFKHTRSKVRYRTNNAKTKDGGRQGAIIFDEIHAYVNEDSIKVFTSGLGKKKNPRRFYFTTDGDNRGGFLDLLKEESVLVLSGDRPKRKTFFFICKLDDAKEVHDEKNWVKANPSLPYFPELLVEMQDEYEKLEDRGGSQVEFMTKRMNIPVSESHENVTEWKYIKAAEEELPDLNGMECIGGVDYSSTTDFTVAGLLFKKDNTYYWKSHTFICHLAFNGRVYKVPIDHAVDEGLVTIVKQDIITPDIVSAWFINQAQTYGYRIKNVASDLYRLSYLQDSLKNAGFPKLWISRSGTKTHTLLEPFINEIFANGRIKWGKDFMMNWYTNNTYKHRDGKGNMSYEKIEPKLRKTDGFHALLHALQFRDELKQEVVQYNPRLKTKKY